MILRNSKRTQIAKNKYAIDGHIGAILMSEDGKVWEDIKPRLVRDLTGWHVDGAPYYAEIKDDGTRLFCPDRNEKSKYFKLPSPPMLSTLTKNVISAPSKIDRQLLPNTVIMPYTDFADIIIEFTNTGMTFSVLFKKAPPRAFKEQFKFDAEVAGLDLKTLLACTEDIGIPRPRLVDANNEIKFFDWTERHGELTLGFDLSGLEFPVLLQNTTIEEQVGASTDDGHEVSGTVTLNWGDFVLDGTTEWIGARWDDINVPAGATVGTTYMIGYTHSTVYDDPNIEIWFENGSNPGTFTTGASNISGRTPTSNSVVWNVSAIGEGWSNTDSLTVPLQEVVDDNSGTGDALVLIAQGKQAGKRWQLRFWDYSGNASGMKIHIEFEAGAAGQPTMKRWGGVPFMAINRGVF